MKNNREKNMVDEVVKSNRLNMAIQNLSLAELRLLQVGIIDSREKNQGLSVDKPLRIEALRYAEAFNVTRQTAYEVMIKAEATLFERRFSFINERDNQVKSRWVSQVEYIKGDGAIEIIFTPAVVREITRINGNTDPFTKFLLEHTSMLNSVYSVRLYELLVQHRTNPRDPEFELETFRGQLGLEVDDYKRMSDFKRRVLDLAVKEINEKTDLKISYKQAKNKSTIIGFKFTVKDKGKPKTASSKALESNADMFTIDNLSDAQLSRITRCPQFCKDFGHLIASASVINRDMNLWSIEFVNRIKKNPEQFNKKRPIKEYLVH